MDCFSERQRSKYLKAISCVIAEYCLPDVLMSDNLESSRTHAYNSSNELNASTKFTGLHTGKKVSLRLSDFPGAEAVCHAQGLDILASVSHQLYAVLELFLCFVPPLLLILTQLPVFILYRL